MQHIKQIKMAKEKNPAPLGKTRMVNEKMKIVYRRQCIGGGVDCSSSKGKKEKQNKNPHKIKECCFVHKKQCYYFGGKQLKV